MKAIKLFSAAIAMVFALNANAQGHFVADFKVGSVWEVGGFGIGLGYQTRILEKSDFELAWDVANFEWTAPFNSPADLDMLSLKTGLRAFSPSFAKDKFRFYTNLSIGYTCVLAKGIISADDIEDYLEDYEKSAMDIASSYLKGLGGDYLQDYSQAYKEASKSVSEAYDDEVDGTSMSAHHGFGLTWGVGLQYNKKWSLGYSLLYETAGKSKSHLVTIGYTF